MQRRGDVRQFYQWNDREIQTEIAVQWRDTVADGITDGITEGMKLSNWDSYWYDKTDREIRVDPHYGLVEINSKARHRNINDVFVFAKQCQQVYYTYTPFFRKDRSRVDWLSVLKTKPKGRVEVVQDENEDTSVIDEVFQASELVEPYRVAPLIDLEENLNFCVFNDCLVDVDAEELNVVLSSTSRKKNIVEEDENKIKECDEADDNNSIEDEDENSD